MNTPSERYCEENPVAHGIAEDAELQIKVSDVDSVKELKRRLNESVRDAGRNGTTAENRVFEEIATEDVSISEEASKTRRYIEAQAQEELNRKKADNEQRWVFFWAIIFSCAFSLVVANGTMIALVCKGTAESPMVVAYFTAVVVQIVGLAAIVARYLFPDGGSLRELKHSDHLAKEGGDNSEIV
ncbi:hypothetical protein CMUST_11395 [Corynebacterium mustelae]|uniref:Uncharacterized protein n=1 Tax=Corynebacterium mustelae TaxID=571915 RepID=A0A0G3H622_9CORY|nr:hypothetical protein [Corynebacterium mustelae]AKK06592.1 hypothetical protein CMUST_11395 [Corynebacterium mustelae]